MLRKLFFLLFVSFFHFYPTVPLVKSRNNKKIFITSESAFEKMPLLNTIDSIKAPDKAQEISASKTGLRRIKER